MARKRLDRAGAAAYIREEHEVPCTKATLQKLASVGGGPPYQRFGNRTFYMLKDLDAWVERKLGAPIESTSEEAA